MTFEIHADIQDGWIQIGPARCAWGTPVPSMELPGFFSLAWGDWSLEMGEIDQGAPGLYLVKCTDCDCHTVRELLQFKRTATTP